MGAVVPNQNIHDQAMSAVMTKEGTETIGFTGAGRYKITMYNTPSGYYMQPSLYGSGLINLSNAVTYFDVELI